MFKSPMLSPTSRAVGVGRKGGKRMARRGRRGRRKGYRK